MEGTIAYIRQRFGGETPPIYLGGFGPKILALAGHLAVTGLKLGGSTNPDLAVHAAAAIHNPHVEIVLGAVSVIDKDRKAARMFARAEVAKYLAVVGELAPTLQGDELESPHCLRKIFLSSQRPPEEAEGGALGDQYQARSALRDQEGAERTRLLLLLRERSLARKWPPARDSGSGAALEVRFHLLCSPDMVVAATIGGRRQNRATGGYHGSG